MEGYWDLQVPAVTVMVYRETCIMGLLGCQTSYGNVVLHTSRLTLLLLEASLADWNILRISQDLSLIYCTMNHTFFFMLIKVVVLSHSKLSSELTEPLSPSAGLVPLCVSLWTSVWAVFQAQLAETLLYNLLWKKIKFSAKHVFFMDCLLSMVNSSFWLKIQSICNKMPCVFLQDGAWHRKVGKHFLTSTADIKS